MKSDSLNDNVTFLTSQKLSKTAVSISNSLEMKNCFGNKHI